MDVDNIIDYFIFTYKASDAARADELHDKVLACVVSDNEQEDETEYGQTHQLLYDLVEGDDAALVMQGLSAHWRGGEWTRSSETIVECKPHSLTIFPIWTEA